MWLEELLFPSVLEKAGAEDTDMIIAVTQNDETNMVICQVAYSIFKINKKIARVRGQEFLVGKWGEALWRIQYSN